jgi:hypothetical protein
MKDELITARRATATACFFIEASVDASNGTAG